MIRGSLIGAMVVMFITSSHASAAAPATRSAAEINKLLGRGVNLGNALEAPAEGEWGVTLQDEYFPLIKQAGFDSIRVPVRWSAHAKEEPPYTIDPKFMARVDWALRSGLAQGVPVVVNVHHYRELYDNPAAQKDRFLALWKQIAEHYKDSPETLLFEVLNEPQSKLTADPWNALIADVLPVIRASNPRRTIIVGPANWNGIGGLEQLQLPADDQNLIVTVHYYLPFHFTHQGASWVEGADKWLGETWTGTDEEKRAVLKDLDTAADWGKRNNRPIYLGEFGANYKADMESRARWTRFVADAAIERGFSFAYWEFCARDFGIYDPATKAWRDALKDALVGQK